MDKNKIQKKSNQPQKRPSKPITKNRLHNGALFYLQKFASSSENLRRVLMRRVDKSAREHGTDPEEGAQWVQEVVDRLQELGLLNDRAYAESKTGSLLRRGNSPKAVRMKLRAKGVAMEDIDASLDHYDEEIEADLDLAAAVAYAKRRRIGPWRTRNRAEQRDKDLAALGRQGFGYDLARRIIDSDDVQELEEALIGM